MAEISLISNAVRLGACKAVLCSPGDRILHWAGKWALAHFSLEHSRIQAPGRPQRNSLQTTFRSSNSSLTKSPMNWIKVDCFGWGGTWHPYHGVGGLQIPLPTLQSTSRTQWWCRAGGSQSLWHPGDHGESPEMTPGRCMPERQQSQVSRFISGDIT